MPVSVVASPRLEALFARTKLLCFGRYALRVPAEAQLIWGGASFPSDISVFSGDLTAARLRAARDVKEIKRESGAEIPYEGDGPIERSWQIRYYANEFAKRDGALFFRTYLNLADLIFVMGAAPHDGESEEGLSRRQAVRARTLRLRQADEVPVDPGYCIEHGFMASDRYDDQEMVNVGLYIPSLPDIAFFISSNKDAYGDYPPKQFDNELRASLSLLNRMKAAQDQQGIHYPSRNVLREGKRVVQHWYGEESLFRRKDGTHDFEWAFVGTPRDVANPSEYSARMHTKVAHNLIGAAKASSLSDDEAVALWDKLLSGLKFRVKVPGAPEGSYHLPLKEEGKP